MEQNMHRIIKRVVMTEKSALLLDKFGQITFEVDRDANKVVIKKAIETLWDVKVDAVRSLNIKGKNKMFARKAFTAPDRKKVVVKLKKGYKIDLPGQFEAMGSGPASESEGN